MIFIGLGSVFGVTVQDKPAILALGAIFIISLTHYIAQSATGKPSGYVIGRTVAMSALLALLYFGFAGGAQILLAGTVPVGVDPGPVGLTLMGLAVLLFGTLSLLQLIAPSRVGNALWGKAYVHLRNGFYVNTYFNRLVGALKVHVRQASQGGNS